MILRCIGVFALLCCLLVANPAEAASASGTTIPPTSQIIDGSGNAWTLASGGYAVENGVKITDGSGFSLLLYYNGSIYAYARSGSWSQWYLYTTTAGNWVHVSGDPRGAPPSDPMLSQPIPSTFFGMHYDGNWPTTIGAVGKSCEANWSSIETAPGVYNWTALDNRVNTAIAHGVDYIWTMSSIPPWAASASNKANCSSTDACGYSNSSDPSCTNVPPANEQDWKNFVTALVTRYKGKIKNYAGWDEAFNGPMTPTQLAPIMVDMTNIIRSIDPAAQIVAPTMNSNFSSATSYEEDFAQSYFRAYANLGGSPADIASFHAYTYNQSDPTCDSPEAIVLAPVSAIIHCSLYTTSLQSIFNTYLPGKPVWNTEGSWQYDDEGYWQTDVLKAAFIARWYILHWANGVSRMYWSKWDSSTYGTLCTEPPSSPCTRLPAATTALQQTYNWLVGKTMYNGCSVASDGVTWTCPLVGPGGYTALIVWDTAGLGSSTAANPQNERYTPPSPSLYTKYRDLAGNVTPYSGGPVTVGIEPILFEN